MTLWFVFALMTAVAVFAVLWPLSRRDSARGGSDIAVYRDQLDEVARDRAAGLIGEPEAEAAKVEVSRRLLAAADAADTEKATSDTPPIWRRRSTAIAGLVLLPVGAVALYLTLGSPQMPGAPLAARMQQTSDESRSVEKMLAQVEEHVLRNPDDGRAWEVLAPVYMRLNRFDDAVRAFRNVIRLNGSNAAREADLGEALIFAANGVVTVEAKTQFDRALALDNQDVMARFYTGMAHDQDGRRAEAEAIWRDLIAKAPPGAAYLPLVRHALERTAPDGAAAAPTASAPAGRTEPSAAEIAAAQKLAPDQQDQMVVGMVARLAERLKKDGSDVEGWQRLVRSYRVLGQNDKAEAAVADARRALAGDPGKLQQFADGAAAAAAPAPMSPAPMSPAPMSPPASSAADGATAQTLAPEQGGHDINAMMARLAARLNKDGSDVEGWLQLVRSYRVMGQSDKAEAAMAEALRALAGNPEKLRQFAEGAAAAGPAPLAPPPPAASAAPAPTAPAPMAPAPIAPGPSAADIAAAQKLAPDQQTQMISTMVARLADRLKQDGTDVEGWLRLLRAYKVMGDRDKAQAAVVDARRALAGDPDKLRRIDELAKELGLEG